MENGAEISTDVPAMTRHRARRLNSVAAVLLILSFLLFLCQLTNFTLFDVQASGMDSLPVSIRADSQADYSGDQHASAVPRISENILNQIITAMPATGSPQDRMGTLQAILSSPVPTMTPDYRYPVTVTPTLPEPTLTPIDSVSNAPLATRFISPTPTNTYVYSQNNVPLATSTKTREPAIKTSTPSSTATRT